MPTHSLLSRFPYKIHIVRHTNWIIFNGKSKLQRISFQSFRCGTHSAVEGYKIDQDLSQDYPKCCAKLVKIEKKSKRVDQIGSSEVIINKFRSRERAVIPKEKKVQPVQKIVEPESADEITEEEISNVNAE